MAVDGYGAPSRVETLEQLLLQMWRIRCSKTRAGALFDEGADPRPRALVRRDGGDRRRRLLEPSAPDDLITSTHRGHGHCIAKGLDLARMMAEILGREDGYCRGHGGSMHITAIDKGMLGADAIVAGSSAIAVGAAHALRLQGRDACAVCFFGDGAANQGILHEAFNLAAVLERAVVFVCENNQWAISTPSVGRHRGATTSRCVPPGTGCRASRWTGTTFSRCKTRRRTPSSARVPAPGRR